MEGQQFNITEGRNQSITCTATGYPAPTVVWQNSDGSGLSNNRLVTGSSVMSSTGVGNETSISVELMVIGAMRVDTGMYRCSANNSVSSITRNIIITIQCKYIVVPHACKFSRGVIFAVFADNLPSMKIESSKNFKIITLHMELKG